MTFTIPADLATQLIRRVLARDRSQYVADAIAAKLREGEERMTRACEIANADPDVLKIEQEWDGLRDDAAQVHELEDRLLRQGEEKLQRELRRLQDLGIIDEHGNRLSKELPADMQEGSDRDFGGWMPAPTMYVVAGPPGSEEERGPAAASHKKTTAAP